MALGLDKPEPITPGDVVEYSIRMNATSHAFLPGHQIRLDITSSDFPNYDRNHNTAADQNADATPATAKQTVYHGGSQATRIIPLAARNCGNLYDGPPRPSIANQCRRPRRAIVQNLRL